MPNDLLAQQPGALLVAQNDECAVWQFRNETGDGTMTAYSIFPGIALHYNDFHMEYFDSGFVPAGNLLAVDHCREGRMEYAAAENAVAYMSAGDMKLDRRLHHTGRFIFPTGHYHGLTVGLELTAARKTLADGTEILSDSARPDLRKIRTGRVPAGIPRRCVGRASLRRNVSGAADDPSSLSPHQNSGTAALSAGDGNSAGDGGIALTFTARR